MSEFTRYGIYAKKKTKGIKKMAILEHDEDRIGVVFRKLSLFLATNFITHFQFFTPAVFCSETHTTSFSSYSFILTYRNIHFGTKLSLNNPPVTCSTPNLTLLNFAPLEFLTSKFPHYIFSSLCRS